MKKLMIILNVVMILIAILGILSAIVLWYYGEDMREWVGAAVLSIFILITYIIRFKNID